MDEQNQNSNPPVPEQQQVPEQNPPSDVSQPLADTAQQMAAPVQETVSTLSPAKTNGKGMMWGIVLVIILAAVFITLLLIYLFYPLDKEGDKAGIVPTVVTQPTVAATEPTPSDEVSVLESEAAGFTAPEIDADLDSLDQQLTQ